MRCRCLLVPTVILSLSVLLAACTSARPTGESAPPGVTEDSAAAPTGPGPDAAAERLAAAPAASIAAGTVRTSYSADLTPPGAPVAPGTSGGTEGASPIRITGEGAIDFSRGQGHTILDLTGLLAGQGLGETDRTFESVVDGDVLYLRSPFLTSLVGADTPWVRLDPSAVTAGTGIDLGQLAGLGSPESGGHLAFLGGVVDGSVRELGTEEVRATTTTHYRATVDLRKAVEAAGAVVDATQLERFAANLGPELAVDAFLDGEGRLRRLRYDQPAPGDAGGAAQRVELDYFDFGAPVAVAIPTPDQVSDLGGIFQGGN